ncbi:DNA cytosine methyltransferase [Bacillus cereus group sp. BC251]|jgi:DNA (cytosine-5)-methyltransferase 1|uniref:DNA cytosine methyltransferase n=2 Tax=Bacillus TaxID=1386 RepID=UPI000C335717|nr:DNA cytosine methyltransferase [Bacillus sp. HBCD-sjtu]AUD25902.1 modification methylase NmeDIP [Bacillus sp. HBCD-sjtu]HDR4391127.1 DNA cytosine methyltransferase [Bacillus cereus]HDR4596022.1 DNA cytosine methyltransferase [Bacillus cereus]HDR4653615.1 DNA cytosine methyltransferase [Bacillus cereus]
MKYPIFSFFSGSGFLDLGFENSGFNIVFANEIHPPFMKSYKHSRKILQKGFPLFGYHEASIKELLEISTLTAFKKELLQSGNEIFGFIGGPPCPDFSVGGKNLGRDGDKGQLSSVYIDLICQEQPTFFLFENVKGLWRTKKHREFYDEMKQKLHHNGYLTTERLINSLEYGVPQNRERIILVGFRKELLEKLGYKITPGFSLEEVFQWEKHIKYPMKKILNIDWPNTSKFKEDSKMKMPKDIIEELTVEYWFNQNMVKSHQNANQFFKPRAGLAKFQMIEEGDDSKKSYKRLHRWRFSPTAAYGNNEVHLHPYKARRLSVAEALAIQSLPREFELPVDISLTNAFKTIGNGVPYLASLGIANTIYEFLNTKNYM